ncbi:hypothetical protein VaNZ11_008205 [Volvox africanus]|uniref:P-type ATPase A domain-containing protein n=1 Tax=Volvox africanus TaxID=51714 RepID=A0ABQ5S4T5_9CHLO|nr:hypothetical protein VaNZ11_008205 [Volvox africanus]
MAPEVACPRHFAMDKCSSTLTYKPLYLQAPLMARRLGRLRNGISAPTYSIAAYRRKYLHVHTKQICDDRGTSRRHCPATAASSLGSGHHSHDHHSQHQNGQHHHEHHHHHHHHHHEHDHGHDHKHHGHHGHDHDHYPDNWATRVMRSFGLVQLASRIEHSGPLAIGSTLCFVVSLLVALPFTAKLLSERVAATLQAAALCGTYLLSGLPQAVSSVALAAEGHLDTHVLMSLAVLATLYLGMVQEGALLLLLFQVSHFLESKFTSRAQGSLEELLATMPERATLVAMTQAASSAQEDGAAANNENGNSRAERDSKRGGGSGPDLSSCRDVLVDSVAVGELVLVRPGEQVPLDGEVVWGVASVSAAHISGEATPARVAAGDWVPAGALSADGALVVRVTAGVDDSTPARIARMATEARASKPHLQRLLDRIGSVWSRGVVTATLVAGLVLVAAGVPLLAAPGGAVYRALGVLVAGSPCAVVLVPLAYVCAMAAVTRRGVLLKGASALDALAACTTVALDKTGTLTTGELRLTEATLLDSRQQLPQPEAATEGAAAAPLSPKHGRDLLPLLQRAAEATAAASGNGAAVGVSRSISVGESVSGSSSEGEGWEWLQQGPPGPRAADPEAEEEWWGEVATRCAVALSRASTHPVSRAVAQAGPGLARGVSVAGLEQVPGSGVRGVCSLRGCSFQVTFGSREFAEQALLEAVTCRRLGRSAPAATSEPANADAAEAEAEAAIARLRTVLVGDSTAREADMAVKAISVLVMTPVPSTHEPDAVDASVGGGAWEVPQIAVFSFEDVVRPGVREAVAALQDGSWRQRSSMDEAVKRAGAAPSESGSALRVVMLTGDNPAVAASVASGLSIPDYRAAMMPQDKLRFVQEEQQHLQQQRAGGEGGWWNAILGSVMGSGGNSGAVLMMGDGINDAPALAAAHVGVAVANSPRDLVAAASDVIVLNGQGAAALPWLLRQAHRTQSVVHQNLTLALASMAFATLPTAAGFFPLWLAVLLHEGSTLAVALNSLRLLLPEAVAASGNRNDDAAGGAAAGGALGPRAVLAEVWRGLCDLAGPEPHGRNQHHHHHHHGREHADSHSHHHGHGKADGRACCGGGNSYSHIDDHPDHQHQHHDHHHVNGHNHSHDCDHEDQGNGRNRKPVEEEEEEVAEVPQAGKNLQSQQKQMSETQTAKSDNSIRDIARVRGSLGRDVSVSAAAWAPHVHCHARYGAASSCCGCSHRGSRLLPLLAAGEGGSLGAEAVHVTGAVRRRRHVASRVGSGVSVGIVAAATTAASAATAAAATFLVPANDVGQ